MDLGGLSSQVPGLVSSPVSYLFLLPSTGLDSFHLTQASPNGFIYRSHLFIHIQITAPTPTITIQLTITPPHRPFHVPTRQYIRHHKIAIPYLTHFSLKDNRSKWQLVSHIPVAPFPHVIWEYRLETIAGPGAC